MGQEEVENVTVNTKFFVRFLPCLDFYEEGIKIDADCKTVYVKCLQKSFDKKKNEKPKFWRFTADEIFWNRSQEDIYDSICGENFVENVLDGVSGMILAYGQTGSGKTFTISGLRHHYEHRGIVLRLLTSLCNEREANKDVKKISIFLSYVEFISAKVKDLLRNKYVESFKDIKKIEIGDEIDTWKSIFEAEVRKSFNDTAPYPGSHKGHTVLTLYVKCLSLIESDPLATYSKVNIVDMSGIDDIGNDTSVWRSNSDLCFSNLSKTLMEQLILCKSGKLWKDSGSKCHKSLKILEYLDDTLHPHCMTRYIGHILGQEKDLPLTLSILRFGCKITDGKPSFLTRYTAKNEAPTTLESLKDEIERLRAVLDMNDMLNNTANYSNMSQEKLQQIRRAAKNFLLGNIEALNLLNIGQAEVTLEAFREVFENFSREKDQAIKDAVMAALDEVQSQICVEKSHTAVASSSTISKTSRRRSSRQRDSKVSLSFTWCSSDSALGSQKSSVSYGGVPDKKGISIGVGKNTGSVEGYLTKAMKKVRSRKSDILAKSSELSNSVKEMGVPCSDTSLSEKVPTKEEAWRAFCSEKPDIIQMYETEITKLEENARIAKKNYTTAMCDFLKLKDAFDKLKREQDDWRHLQKLCMSQELEDEEMEEEANTEMSYDSVMEKKGVELNSAMEKCHVTLIDYRNSTEELAEAKTALENDFRNFCCEAYKTWIILDEELLEEVHAKRSAECVDETDTRIQTKIEMYFEFQSKMMSFVPRRKRPKWVAYFKI